MLLTAGTLIHLLSFLLSVLQLTFPYEIFFGLKVKDLYLISFKIMNSFQGNAVSVGPFFCSSTLPLLCNLVTVLSFDENAALPYVSTFVFPANGLPPLCLISLQQACSNTFSHASHGYLIPNLLLASRMHSHMGILWNV